MAVPQLTEQDMALPAAAEAEALRELDLLQETAEVLEAGLPDEQVRETAEGGTVETPAVKPCADQELD